jgi:2-oxoglutarate dehydrogenase E2 component (dihydrolipoamide succinyltransferase)
MATEIKMPQLGETVVEGTITRWLKKEGDRVAEDDLLVEISTDKVDSEVPSTVSGVLTKILVQEGETVRVGTPIAIVGEPGEEAPPAKQAPAEGHAPPEDRAPALEQQQANPELARAEQSAAPPPPPPPAQPASAARPAPAAPAETPSADLSKRGVISPLVRRLADEHDVDLDEIEGTGTGGRIRKQDVLAYIERRKSSLVAAEPAAAQPPGQPAAEPVGPAVSQPAAEAAPARAGAREELVPWTNIRRRTAEHMAAAHLEAARAWNAVEVDWTNIAKLRARAKDAFKAKEGFSLTYMPFLCKAVCDTLLEMPVVNATFDEEHQANLVKHYVNLGIAVALEGGGLIVPVIHGADEKNLVGLARAVNDLAGRARTKKLTPDDLVGGTFTITNPGPFGSIISVPIIPRGTTGILGFETITKRVVVTDDDQIAIRHIGILDMSWDHRVIDGAEAATFLAKLKERLETTDYSADLGGYL